MAAEHMSIKATTIRFSIKNPIIKTDIEFQGDLADFFVSLISDSDFTKERIFFTLVSLIESEDTRITKSEDKAIIAKYTKSIV